MLSKERPHHTCKTKTCATKCHFVPCICCKGWNHRHRPQVPTILKVFGQQKRLYCRHGPQPHRSCALRLRLWETLQQNCSAQNAGPNGDRGTADCGLLFDDFPIVTSLAHAEASVLIIPILHGRLTTLSLRQPIDGSVISSAMSIRSWRRVGEPA